jgi:hypothetical protein
MQGMGKRMSLKRSSEENRQCPEWNWRWGTKDPLKVSFQPGLHVCSALSSVLRPCCEQEDRETPKLNLELNRNPALTE